MASVLAALAALGRTAREFAQAALIRGERTRAEQNPISAPLHAVRCPTTQVCFVAADGGTVWATTDGGNNWSTTASAGPTGLWGISGTDVKNRIAVGLHGTIVRTTDGGASGASVCSGTTPDLFGVSCPSTTRCVAVGQGTTGLTISGTVVHPASANAPLYSRAQAVTKYGGDF